MTHIYDELTYLKGDTIMFLNDTYLTQFNDLTIEDIQSLKKIYKQIVKQLSIKDINEDLYIEEKIKVNKNRYLSLYIKEIHLYQMKIICLDDIRNRKGGK